MTSFSLLRPPSKFKLFISPYQLKWKNKRKAPLEGVLCAFDFGLKQIGYSDFLPWASMGEKPLNQQLEEIKEGNETQRFKIAKHNAFIDARARKEQKNLFFSLQPVPSHFLIEDIKSFKENSGFKTFKTIKVKLKAEQRIQQTQALRELNQKIPNLLWRLDLNGASWQGWDLSFLRGKIDFIEDPETFSLKDFSLLAEDWIPCSKAQIKIVKPSRDFVFKGFKSFFRKKRIIFTHSFDHPLGQITSAFWAAWFYKYYPVFWETGALCDFQLEKLKKYPLKYKQGLLQFPQGFGFGFTSALKEEKWREWI